MRKDKLISITNGMCEELLNTINDNNFEYKDDIANFLVESAHVIMNAQEDTISKASFAAILYSNAYKELVQKSLSAYEETNQNIDNLSKIHKKTLSQCHDEDIDIPVLASKFDEIHLSMKDEVKKANKIINQLTKQVKKLDEKSNLDPLTRVYNRHALTTYMDTICSRDNQPENLHVLLIDLDDFKHINDTYGHIAGDKVLIFIAHIINKTLRDGDKIFRYGGEEFLIVLNRLDDKECATIAKRLLNLVRENKLIYKGKSLGVTISMGITRYSKGDTQNTLVTRADKALYEAKNSGKNQIRVENITDGI